jgi:hypothetical protein
MSYLTYLSPSPYYKEEVEAWQTLVHVCRRWRSLVLRSPRRLNLRLVCAPETRTRDPDTLDVWPALPLIVQGNMFVPSVISGTDNIIVALGQSNRVCQVNLWGLVNRQLEQDSAAMQVPFPELTYLQLTSHDETPPVLPDSFLGGSAPRLRYFLEDIPFPGLPNLLLSATHLVQLWLIHIPPSGYISPEAMVASLSALSSSKPFTLDSNPLNLTLTGKSDVLLHQNALSSPLSTILLSMVFLNI